MIDEEVWINGQSYHARGEIGKQIVFTPNRFEGGVDLVLTHEEPQAKE